MSKLDHLIQSIDRLVELNEEMLLEIRGFGLRESSSSEGDKRSKINSEILEQLLDSSEVMEKLKISKSTLSRNVKTGLFTPIRIGKQNRFDMNQIEVLRNYFLK